MALEVLNGHHAAVEEKEHDPLRDLMGEQE
jgi:hypothetical protein